MKVIAIMNAREFIEVATDALVRGDDYRPHPPVMKEVARNSLGVFLEPPEDYLDQLWGRCLTQHEASLYQAVSQQLVDAFKSGELPSRKPPLMVPNRGGTSDLEGSVIYLGDFKAWIKRDALQCRKNWYALVMAATEPKGGPVRIEGMEQPVQLREKATRAPKIPTRAMLAEWSAKLPYGEDVGRNAACQAFSKWLKEAGHMRVTSRTLNKWFAWNNRTYKLEPTQEAIDRGFETNGVEAS
jgi:hypothetical protein